MLLWWLRNWRYWLPLLLALCFGISSYFRNGMVATFGVGLTMLALAFLVFLYMLWWRRFNLLWRYWRWWLLGAVLAIWLFGFLAFFSTHQGSSTDQSILHKETLGGRWGQCVIGGRDVDVWGVLRLAGILLVALLIISPRRTLSALRRFFWDILGIGELYKKYIEPSRLWRWLRLSKEEARLLRLRPR